MTPNPAPRKAPITVLIIHVLAYIGVALWTVIFAMALLGKFEGNRWLIMLLAVAFAFLHFAISWLTHKRSHFAITLIWVLLFADLGLILVTWRAVILVLAAVVILVAVTRPINRSWFRASV